MSRLLSWNELPPGGMVQPGTAERTRTGGWRTGLRPEVDLSACVDCLLCWLYCPDSAIVLDGEAFAGFDLEVCKGCELCSVVCPTGAVRMVAEDD
jgi:2-oxoacid:acceptor oxidoreductase delta subunit (pyruvate/2-ketoisovalerate family)